MKRLTRKDNSCLAEGEVMIQEDRGGISVHARPWDSTIDIKAWGGDPTRKNQYAHLTWGGVEALIVELQKAQDMLAKKDT